MEDEIKRYYLKLKLRKGNNIEYVTLLHETLTEIDKVTTISYTKEKLIMLFPKDYVSYLLENYDEIDLVITEKENEYPVLLKKDIEKAYITDEDIAHQIKFKVLLSREFHSEEDILKSIKGIKGNEDYSRATKLSDFYLPNGIGRRKIIDFLEVISKDFYNEPKLRGPKGIFLSPIKENIDNIAHNIEKILESIRHEIGKMNQTTLDGFEFIRGSQAESPESFLYNAKPLLLEMLKGEKSSEYNTPLSYVDENTETDEIPLCYLRYILPQTK